MNIIPQLFFGFCLFAMNFNAHAQGFDIFNAARSGDTLAIQHYVQQGGDINIANDKGYTPFILAAYYGKTQALQTLLNLGANVCAVDNKGSNAFMGVAFKGYQQVAKWLLKNTRCNVNHQNTTGQTALMMASLFGREEMIKLLLEFGANPDLADNQGNTSVKLAQAQGLSRVVDMIQFHLQ